MGLGKNCMTVLYNVIVNFLPSKSPLNMVDLVKEKIVKVLGVKVHNDF